MTRFVLEQPNPPMIERRRFFEFEVASWHEQAEDGHWWWHAMLSRPYNPYAKVFRSRVSRQRAQSYAMAECVQMLHDYDPTTRVD